jgi:hypothetical protein
MQRSNSTGNMHAQLAGNPSIIGWLQMLMCMAQCVAGSHNRHSGGDAAARDQQNHTAAAGELQAPS